MNAFDPGGLYGAESGQRNWRLEVWKGDALNAMGLTRISSIMRHWSIKSVFEDIFLFSLF